MEGMPTLSALAGFSFLAAGIGIGVFTTYTSIRNARGPKEKTFVLWNNFFAWLVIVVLLGLMYLLPSPYRYLLLIPYFLHLPVVVYRYATKVQLIRRLEEIEAAGEEQEARPA